MVRLSKQDKEILLARLHTFSQSERLVMAKLGFKDPMKLILYLQKYQKHASDTSTVY